jgi:hypothetical protein
MPVERVRRVRASGDPMTGKVRHEDASRESESGSNGGPRAMRVAEPVQKDEGPSAPQFDPMNIDPFDADRRTWQRWRRHTHTLSAKPSGPSLS